MCHRSARSKRQFANDQHDFRTVRKEHRRRVRGWLKTMRAMDAAPYILQARRECHRVFDLLWVGPLAPMTRSGAYKYLMRITGMTRDEAHIALFDVGVCLGVIEQIYADFPCL